MINVGSLVSWKSFSGRVLNLEAKILWIQTPEGWYVGIPSNGEGLTEVSSLAPADVEAMESPRQARRRLRREKKLAEKAKKQAKIVKANIQKANSKSDEMISGTEGWIDFKGSQSLPPGSYKVIAGPFSSRSLGKSHITDENNHKCIKLGEGIYYIVFAK